MLVVAAQDRRVEAVVSQVPLISGRANFKAMVRADFIKGFQSAFDADRAARYSGAEPEMVPVVDEDPLASTALPTPDSYVWFSETGASRAPSWRNEVTTRSVEMFSEYEPGASLPWISPTPLLLLVAREDQLTPSELQLRAYETALQPKELVIVDGGHFDAYIDGFEASTPARRRLTGSRSTCSDRSNRGAVLHSGCAAPRFGAPRNWKTKFGPRSIRSLSGSFLVIQWRQSSSQSARTAL